MTLKLDYEQRELRMIQIELLRVMRPKAHNDSKQGSYNCGVKRCSECDAWFSTTDIKCSVCKFNLKTKPRSKTDKKSKDLDYYQDVNKIRVRHVLRFNKEHQDRITKVLARLYLMRLV